MTQNKAILDHLRKGNAITPILALNQFGCFRLRARIWTLKKEGWNIRTRIVNNGEKHFAEYFLEPRIESNGQVLMI